MEMQSRAAAAADMDAVSREQGHEMGYQRGLAIGKQVGQFWLKCREWERRYQQEPVRYSPRYACTRCGTSHG